MNEIVLRGRPIKRLLFIGLVIVLLAIFLPPAFVEIDCGFTNRIKCEVYKFAGPYFAVFVAIILVIPYRRFLLGRPVVTLTRDGIDAGVHPMGMIPWADIEGVEIRRVRFAELLAIRRKADTVRPPRSFFDRIPSVLFGSNARTHLQISQIHIDRPLYHLKHWVEDGIRNAAAGVSPDPFFTVPY